MGKNSPDSILKAVKRPRGGVNVDHRKITKELPCERIDPPAQVVLPMQQHIGAPCTPLVKIGDRVKVGQKIGDSDKFVSAPIHSSVSGTVKAIGETITANGARTQAITIENDGLNELSEEIMVPKIESRQDFLTAVRESGLVGLGGAGFPTHVKLAFKPDSGVDTLIINAAECEPYITVDYRECVDNSWDVYSGVEILSEILGFKKIFIVTEDDKNDALQILKNIADKDANAENKVRLMAVKAKYPQGAEKLMVQSATGRIVPEGGLPSDVGCVVMNVGSVAFISRYLKTGKPLVSRSVTVSGGAIKNPKNLRVPIGTSVQTLIDYCGGFGEQPEKILAGGPMMGTALFDTSVPLLKNNNAVLALTHKECKRKKETSCIHCGSCVDACPMSLIPTLLVKLAKKSEGEELVKNGINICMECGSCSYSCPAGIDLVQYLRQGKQIAKKVGAKK